MRDNSKVFWEWCYVQWLDGAFYVDDLFNVYVGMTGHSMEYVDFINQFYYSDYGVTRC